MTVLTPDDEDETDPQQALLELTVQAPHDDCIRSELIDFETALVDRLHEIIERGVESGVFDPRLVPDIAAEFLATAIFIGDVSIDGDVDGLFVRIQMVSVNSPRPVEFSDV